MRRKNIFLLFLIALIILLPKSVLAAEGDNYICVGGNLYEVKSKGANVQIYQIESEHLKNSSVLPLKYFEMKTYLKDHNAKLETAETDLKSDWQEFQNLYGDVYTTYKDLKDEKPYKFDAVSLNRKCSRKVNSDGSYKWQSCPTKQQAWEKDSPYSLETLFKNLTEGKGLRFDQARGQYYLELKDKVNSTVIVRVVKNGKLNLEEYDLEGAKKLGIVRNDELTHISGTTRIYFSLGRSYDLEFYLAPSIGECGNSYLGSLDVVAPDFADIPNPWKNAKVCENFRNSPKYDAIPDEDPTDTNLTEEEAAELGLINYKRILVPECYDDTIDYNDRNKFTEAIIQEKIDKVLSMFELPSNAVQNDLTKLSCTFVRDETHNVGTATRKYVLGGGGYWNASCTETVEVRFDPPKATNAGGGFDYNTTLTVTRKCTPHNLKLATKPTKCTYGIECYGGPLNHTGQVAAGPNEDFDACVNTCDGGTYSQGCIDQCYSKVYEGKDVKLSMMRYGYNFSDVIEARRMISYNDKKVSAQQVNTPLGSEIANEAGRDNQGCNERTPEGYPICTSQHGNKFMFRDECVDPNNPTVCYEVYTSRRPCSDNPDQDYQNALGNSRSEYNRLMDKISNYEVQSHKYSNKPNEVDTAIISIIDSHKRNPDKPDEYLVTTNNSYDNMVKMVGGEVYSKATNKSTVRIGSEGETVEIATYEVKKEYQVDLPQAVIDQMTGLETYVKTDYEIPNHELDGGNKYYTDLNSPMINDWRKWKNEYGNWNYDYLDEAKYNINVTFKNVGTKIDNGYTWSKINIDCFYGLINKNYVDCVGKDCDPNCKGDDCDDESDKLECKDGDVCTGGIQYMFREVNLKDLFPGRDPRWNWTYKAGSVDKPDAYGYYSDPSRAIDAIETLGNGAYNQEKLEYEIVLTKQNINNIRRENRKFKNYLDYDMTCYFKYGKKVCESNLLDNTNFANSFIKYREFGTYK